jgi:hypothetical protein
MDPPVQNNWDEDNYDFYNDGEGVPYRSNKKTKLVDYLRGGQWHKTNTFLEYMASEQKYICIYDRKIHYLTPRVKFNNRQIAGRGGMYKKYESNPKIKSVNNIPKKPKIKLQGKQDFSSQSIEESIDNIIKYSSGDLSFPQILHSAHADMLAAMCSDSSWLSINVVVGDSESLNLIIDLAAKNNLQKFSIEIYGADNKALEKLAKFLSQSSTLEEVTIKIKDPQAWELIINGVIKDYQNISKLNLNGPLDSADFNLLIIAFSRNNKIKKSTIVITNHNIEIMAIDLVARSYKNIFTIENNTVLSISKP